jgi:hypothetical protein
MTGDLRRTERVARVLCSRQGQGGFCDCVGGSLGCQVGRGEGFDGTNCKASRDQLILSGLWATAEAAINAAQ